MNQPHGLKLGRHAKVRMQQRGVSSGDLDVVLEFGRLYYRRGRQVEVLYLREKDLPYHARRNSRARRAVGVAALIEPSGRICTVYRTKHLRRLVRGMRWTPLRHDRREV